MPSDLRSMARASAETRSARARQRAADLAPLLTELRASGATSLRTLAARLTEAGIAGAVRLGVVTRGREANARQDQGLIVFQY